MATLVNYTCKSFIKLTPGCKSRLHFEIYIQSLKRRSVFLWRLPSTFRTLCHKINYFARLEQGACKQSMGLASPWTNIGSCFGFYFIPRSNTRPFHSLGHPPFFVKSNDSSSTQHTSEEALVLIQSESWTKQRHEYQSPSTQNTTLHLTLFEVGRLEFWTVHRACSGRRWTAWKLSFLLLSQLPYVSFSATRTTMDILGPKKSMFGSMRRYIMLHVKYGLRLNSFLPSLG